MATVFVSIFEYPWGIREAQYLTAKVVDLSPGRVKYRVLYQDLIKIARDGRNGEIRGGFLRLRLNY